MLQEHKRAIQAPSKTASTHLGGLPSSGRSLHLAHRMVQRLLQSALAIRHTGSRGLSLPQATRCGVQLGLQARSPVALRRGCRLSRAQAAPRGVQLRLQLPGPRLPGCGPCLCARGRRASLPAHLLMRHALRCQHSCSMAPVLQRSRLCPAANVLFPPDGLLLQLRDLLSQRCRVLHGSPCGAAGRLHPACKPLLELLDLRLQRCCALGGGLGLCTRSARGFPLSGQRGYGRAPLRRPRRRRRLCARQALLQRRQLVAQPLRLTWRAAWMAAGGQ